MRLAGFFVVLAVLAAPAVRAQDDAAAPVENAGEAVSLWSGARATQGTPGGAVDIDLLTMVDRDALGLMDDQRGGLGVDLWRESRAASVLASLRSMGELGPAWAPLRDVVRRALLTAATPPRDAAPGVLFDVRVETLLRLGDAESALGLLNAVPRESLQEPARLALLRALLWAGLTDEACALQPHQDTAAPDALWDRVRAVCHVSVGDVSGAQLTLDLLREAGSSLRPAFADLMSLALGQRQLSPALPMDVRAEEAALAVVLGVPLPPAWLDSGPAATWPLLARAVESDPQTRIQAAEQSFLVGLVDLAELRLAYAETPLPEEAAMAPLNAWQGLPPVFVRARAARALASQDLPMVQAEILARATQRAAPSTLLMLARAHAEALAAMPPEPALSWMAGVAGPAAYWSGDQALGQAWLALAETATTDARGLPVVPHQAWLMGAVLDPQTSLEPAQDPARWPASLAARDAAAALLRGMGRDVLPPAQIATTPRRLLQTEARPTHTVWTALEQALLADRRAEALLLVVATLSAYEAPEAVPADVLGRLLQALRVLGLDAEARSIASLAMLALLS